MAKIFTAGDVASHNKPDSLYITIDGDVYDLTKFQDDHPGARIQHIFPQLYLGLARTNCES
jgi:cytochrome b involved in lipid metabolism